MKFWDWIINNSEVDRLAGTDNPRSTLSRMYEQTSTDFQKVLETKDVKDVKGANTPCRSCTMCCHLPMTPELYPEFDESPDDYDCYQKESEVWALKNKDDGSCIYLGDKGCTIYARRPFACKIYDCRHWVAVSVMPGKDITEAPCKRVLSWDLKKMVRTRQDKIRFIACFIARNANPEMSKMYPMACFLASEQFLAQAENALSQFEPLARKEGSNEQ